MKSRFLSLVIPMLISGLINISYADKVDYPIVIESGTKDTLNQIQSLAKSEQIARKPMGDIVAWVGLQLLNSPYSYYLLDKKTPEYLYVSLSQTDCMLFVEEVIVVSRLIKMDKLNLASYIDGIKQIRYHGDVAYCNRNHYFKDWAVMNESQGIVEDMGLRLGGQVLPNTAHILGDNIVKNKDNIHYASLSCIRDREKVVNTETIGFIPIKKLSKYLKDIQSGDIVGVVASNPIKSDAVRHLGIAYVNNGKVGYLNASSLKHKVVIYDSLMDYLTDHKDAGIVLLRVKP